MFVVYVDGDKVFDEKLIEKEKYIHLIEIGIILENALNLEAVKATICHEFRFLEHIK